MRVSMLAIPVSLNGVGGDGNKAAIVALEGRGKRAEEAGRHSQEIALDKKLLSILLSMGMIKMTRRMMKIQKKIGITS